MSLAPQLEWRRLSARMLLIHPVREVGRFIPAIAGRPVYLAMAMDAEHRLKLKPQNLLLNLPLARQQ